MIEAISATSAGAMNAVAMASGMASGGADGARQNLHAFWYEVSRMDLGLRPVLAAQPMDPGAEAAARNITRSTPSSTP